MYYDDDDDGLDVYQPSFYTSTDADPTSSQRIIEGTNVSAAAKRRVDKATDKRCLIENTPESNHIEYAHCLPRPTEGPMASSFSHLILTSNNNP